MAVSERLGPERWAEVNGMPVAYRRRGSGDPLLFVHGGVVNADLWRDVVPVLAHRYDCISPDLPAGSHQVPIGRAEYLSPAGIARLIVELLDVLGLDRVTLVGNDSGGAIGQMVATAHPERIARLVLTSCDAFDNFPPVPLRFVHALRDVPGLVRALLFVLMRFRPARAAFYRSVAHRRIEPNVMASYTVAARDPRIRRELERFFHGIDAQELLDAARRLPQVTAPALVAWGADDPWFPERHGRELARLMPNATFRLLPAARTFVPEDQPVLLAELIAGFLEEHAIAA